MRSLNVMLLPLVYALALCSCATTGHALPVCPQPQPIPHELLKKPNYEQKLREILFKSVPPPTQKSKPTKP